MANFRQHILLPLLLLAGLLHSPLAVADDQDFASDVSISAKKDITKKLDAEVGAGLRFANNSSQLDRYSLEGSMGYEAIKKWLDLEAGYTFIADWNGEEDQYFSFRHRYCIGADLYHKVTRRLGLNLHPKWQSTYRVESMKTYKWNPKNYLRVKLGAQYKVKGLPLTPHFSAETFCQMNNPEGNVMDNMRYNLGVKYSMDRHNTFDLSFQIDDEMNVSKPQDRFMLCVGYKYKF